MSETRTIRFYGHTCSRSVDPTDLDAMSRAIQEGCEKIEPHAW